jgi:hypothetical protein
VKPPKKTNWKASYGNLANLYKETHARFLSAEKEQAESKRQYLELKKELVARPTVEKIVEKEVLPSWLVYVYGGLAVLFCISWFVFFCVLKQLEQPILKPYAVEVITDRSQDALISCQAHDKAATEAWKEDERTIRQLKRRMEP